MDENKGPRWFLWLSFPCCCLSMSISSRLLGFLCTSGQAVQTAKLVYGCVNREQVGSLGLLITEQREPFSVVSVAIWKTSTNHTFFFYFFPLFSLSFYYQNFQTYTEKYNESLSPILPILFHLWPLHFCPFYYWWKSGLFPTFGYYK